jgi:hypothetical protein
MTSREGKEVVVGAHQTRHCTGRRQTPQIARIIGPGGASDRQVPDNASAQVIDAAFTAARVPPGSVLFHF